MLTGPALMLQGLQVQKHHVCVWSGGSGPGRVSTVRKLPAAAAVVGEPACKPLTLLAAYLWHAVLLHSWLRP
jgi:hypothetical protein